ncbi:MAG: hypothetical protein ACRYHA_04945 [Janthinobacterium lividum]
MSCSIRIALAICALSTAALALPAQAQLHGDWPADAPQSTIREGVSAHAERVGAHSASAALDVPRGDLRRDVSEASRSLPREHGQ